MTFITIESLDRGLEKWFARRGWESDLHSSFYQMLLHNQETMPIDRYWSFLVDTLAGWKALRPLTKREIYGRGSTRYEEMDRLIRYVQRKYPTNNSLEDAEWQNLEALFDFSKGIKNVSSPVFASKMCHFIFPNLFPVIDNIYTGIETRYYEYWSSCKKGWLACENPQEIVSHFIQVGKVQVFERYPYQTKIAEICYAGRRK